MYLCMVMQIKLVVVVPALQRSVYMTALYIYDIACVQGTLKGGRNVVPSNSR